MDITTLKYELYCETCGYVTGYTDHHFTTGEMLLATHIYYWDGTQAKAGDRPKHDPSSHLETLKLRPNPMLCKK